MKNYETMYLEKSDIDYLNSLIDYNDHKNRVLYAKGRQKGYTAYEMQRVLYFYNIKPQYYEVLKHRQETGSSTENRIVRELKYVQKVLDDIEGEEE